jgi:hypothetical protein
MEKIMSNTSHVLRALQDDELEAVSGGAEPAVVKVLYEYLSNVIKAYGDAMHEAARLG